MSDKVWTKEEIRENLETKDLWVLRGILAIFDRQTADEQSSETTKHHNDVGFNGVDGRIMSSFAKQIQNFKPGGRFTCPLSKKQMAIARKKIVKYSGQLAKIANGKI